jgi:hypothetical protein
LLNFLVICAATSSSCAPFLARPDLRISASCGQPMADTAALSLASLINARDVETALQVQTVHPAKVLGENSKKLVGWVVVKKDFILGILKSKPGTPVASDSVFYKALSSGVQSLGPDVALNHKTRFDGSDAHCIAFRRAANRQGVVQPDEIMEYISQISVCIIPRRSVLGKRKDDAIDTGKQQPTCVDGDDVPGDVCHPPSIQQQPVESTPSSAPFPDVNFCVLDSMPTPLSLSHDALHAMLSENIEVYEQLHVARASTSEKYRGLQVQWKPLTEKGVCFTRLQFLRFFIVWLATCVLQHSLIVLGNAHFPSDSSVSEAIKIVQRETSTAELLISRYFEYLFDRTHRKGDVLGYYAKDKVASGVLKSRLLDVTTLYTDSLNAVLSKDVLAAIAPGVSGMSWGSSWLYSGGVGLAGWHYEDGFLHFAHQVVDLAFPPFLDRDHLLGELLSLCQALTCKVWAVYKDGSPQGVLSLSNILAKSFGWNIAADETLVSRLFVLDPRTLDGHFDLVYQKAGQCIISNRPHSVLGFSLLSFACNLCFESFIPQYLEGESIIADQIRKNMPESERLRSALLSNPSRGFVLSAALTWHCMQNLESPHARALLRFVKHLWEKEGKLNGCIQGVVQGLLDGPVPTEFNHAQCAACGIGLVRKLYYPVKKGKKTSRAADLFYCLECCNILKKDVGLVLLFGSVHGLWAGFS